MSDPQSPDAGASSIESWDDEPACTFDPDVGFSINQQSLNSLRWYSYLSPDALDDETLLESRNDE